MSGMVRADTWWASEHGRYEPVGYLSEALVCARCGGPLPVQRRQGRPRKWCSESCRVAAYRTAKSIESSKEGTTP